MAIKCKLVEFSDFYLLEWTCFTNLLAMVSRLRWELQK